MNTKKAKELLLKYGSMSDLTGDELGDIINLLEQGEIERKFLDSLEWTTIYKDGKILLETQVVYWDNKKTKERW